MSKEQKDSKVLAIRIPTPLFQKFKDKCDENSWRMSEVVRLYVRDFCEHGISGVVVSQLLGHKEKIEDK